MSVTSSADRTATSTAGSRYDVIVVGAGISGLTAATALREKGLHVLVVEANDRVGGRTWAGEEMGGTLDYGGMYIGIGHNESIGIGTSLGLEMSSARRSGEMIYVLPEGKVRAPDGDLAGIWPQAEQLYSSFAALDALAESVSVDSPWDSASAGELDSTTVATWLDMNISDPAVKKIHQTEVNGIVGADPSEVSMLYWLWYIKASQGVHSLRFDVNDALWIGGAQQISTGLAQRLDGNVLLSWPVTHVEHHSQGVTVRSGDRQLSASCVVLALPPSGAHRIRFEPQLPHKRNQLQMRAPMGRMSKVQVRYPKPFWRDQGLTGEICDTSSIGVVVLDVTRPGDSMASVVGFIGGRDYDRFFAQTEEVRREQFLALLVNAYGEQAAEPVFYHETRWPEQPWQMGGPVTFMPPGLLTEAGAALRAPIGRIHFAGTETATRFSGFMEGAVMSGRRAAAEVEQMLSTQ